MRFVSFVLTFVLQSTAVVSSRRELRRGNGNGTTIVNGSKSKGSKGSTCKNPTFMMGDMLTSADGTFFGCVDTCTGEVRFVPPDTTACEEDEIPFSLQTAGTDVPTTSPTIAPTDVPTSPPTEIPTQSPTNAPTQVPTVSPTNAPTEIPTTSPTNVPTESPSETRKPLFISVTQNASFSGSPDNVSVSCGDPDYNAISGGFTNPSESNTLTIFSFGPNADLSAWTYRFGEIGGGDWSGVLTVICVLKSHFNELAVP